MSLKWGNPGCPCCDVAPQIACSNCNWQTGVGTAPNAYQAYKVTFPTLTPRTPPTGCTGSTQCDPISGKTFELQFSGGGPLPDTFCDWKYTFPPDTLYCTVSGGTAVYDNILFRLSGSPPNTFGDGTISVVTTGGPQFYQMRWGNSDTVGDPELGLAFPCVDGPWPMDFAYEAPIGYFDLCDGGPGSVVKLEPA